MRIVCENCKTEFTDSPEHIAFRGNISPVFLGNKMHIPAPSLCWQCRWQRRLAFRNERNLYKRSCDLTGKSMISMHSEDVIFPVYNITDWLSDKWEPLDYGVDFNFNKPFFEQFKSMCDKIPHFSLFVDPNMDINSDYTNCASESKNCYLISQAERNEDCLYDRGINNCKNCVDCMRITDSELCYEGRNIDKCYKCLFCSECSNSSDCYFSSNLRGCKNCFGCHGLVQKTNYIYNKPVTEEQWNKFMEKLELTNSTIKFYEKESNKIKDQTPKRDSYITSCSNVIGDHVMESRDSNYVFDCKNLEHCNYCFEILSGAKNCQDYSMWGINCEGLYECNGCGYNVYNTLFSNHCWQNISNLIYCESCFPAVKNCFGCFGLKNKEYCILNKQYSKEEYEKLVSKIIEHMIETNEYGEFFPIEISPYAYNESLANEKFPISKKEALSKKYNWKDSNEPIDSSYIVKQNIEYELSDKILDEILYCANTGKQYKITPHELNFYKQMNLPIPVISPQERHKIRNSKQNPCFLWSSKCDKCNQDIQTSNKPDDNNHIYCKSCYLDELT